MWYPLATLVTSCWSSVQVAALLTQVMASSRQPHKHGSCPPRTRCRGGGSARERAGSLRTARCPYAGTLPSQTPSSTEQGSIPLTLCAPTTILPPHLHSGRSPHPPPPPPSGLLSHLPKPSPPPRPTSSPTQSAKPEAGGRQFSICLTSLASSFCI